MQGRKTMNEAAFQFYESRANAFLLLVPAQELLFDHPVEFPKVHVADSIAHRYQDLTAGFNQYAFIDRKADLTSIHRFICQDAWHQGSGTVKSVR